MLLIQFYLLSGKFIYWVIENNLEMLDRFFYWNRSGRVSLEAFIRKEIPTGKSENWTQNVAYLFKTVPSNKSELGF